MIQFLGSNHSTIQKDLAQPSSILLQSTSTPATRLFEANRFRQRYPTAFRVNALWTATTPPQFLLLPPPPQSTSPTLRILQRTRRSVLQPPLNLVRFLKALLPLKDIAVPSIQARSHPPPIHSFDLRCWLPLLHQRSQDGRVRAVKRGRRPLRR